MLDVCWMAAYLQLRNSLEFEQQLHHLRIVPCHWGVIINHKSSVIQIGWEFRRPHTKIVPRCSRTAAWRGKYALRQALFLLIKLSVNLNPRGLLPQSRACQRGQKNQQSTACPRTTSLHWRWRILGFLAKSLSAMNKSKLIAHSRPQGKISILWQSVFWVLRQATILLEPSEHLSLGLRQEECITKWKGSNVLCFKAKQKISEWRRSNLSYLSISLTGLALFLATISSISCPQFWRLKKSWHLVSRSATWAGLFPTNAPIIQIPQLTQKLEQFFVSQPAIHFGIFRE